MSSTVSTYNNAVIRLLANTVLVASLMPYLSPVVIPDMDVQPASHAICIAVLVGMMILMPRQVLVYHADFAVFGLGLLTFLYVDFTRSSVDLAWIRSCAPVFLGFPVYFAVRNLYQYMSPRVFVWVVALYGAVLIFQVALPRAYLATVGHLLSDTRWFAEEGRGPNGLCPEPSMMGNMCALFVIMLYFFHRKYWHQHRRATWFVVIASGFMLVVTKSATGVVLAIVLLAVAVFSSKMSLKVKTLLTASVVLFTVLSGALLSKSEIRGATVLSLVAQNPALVLEDPSLAVRFLGVFVGVYQLGEAPLGNGSVGIDQELTGRALNGSLAKFMWPDDTLRGYLVGMSLSFDRNTGIGSMIQRMGVVGIFVVVMFLKYIRGFHGKWVVRAFVFALFFNATLFISTLWFVVGCCIALEHGESEQESIETSTETKRRRSLFRFIPRLSPERLEALSRMANTQR